MSEGSTPPGHVKVAIPKSAIWTVVLAVLGTLVKLCFSLEADYIHALEKAGGYEARLKQLEDRKASLESRVDVLEHRMSRTEDALR